jgi:hypothetical protein
LLSEAHCQLIRIVRHSGSPHIEYGTLPPSSGRRESGGALQLKSFTFT